MSVEIISLVLNHSKAEGRAKVVLIGIANHQGDNGAWPSIATLARYANSSERSVKRDIKYLQDIGELVVEAQGGEGKSQYKTNKYWVSISGVTDGAIRGDRLGKSGVTDLAHKTLKEPYINLYAHFDEFWNVYPRKVSKRAAIKAYESALTRASHDEILAGAIRFGTDKNLPDTEFIPYPTTWLNGDRWLDGPLPERKRTKEEQQAEWAVLEEQRKVRAKVLEDERAAEYQRIQEAARLNPPKRCKHDKVIYNCFECKCEHGLPFGGLISCESCKSK